MLQARKYSTITGFPVPHRINSLPAKLGINFAGTVNEIPGIYFLLSYERRKGQMGFTYLAVMFMVIIIGLSLGTLGEVWHTMARREKERELLFVGDQFRRGIKQYYVAHPATAHRYPSKLKDLLGESVGLTTRRYLRQVYADPITGKYEWGLIKSRYGEIMGVYSLSKKRPLKTGNFPKKDRAFAGSKTYSGWKFVFAGTSSNAAAEAGKQVLPTQSKFSNFFHRH